MRISSLILATAIPWASAELAEAQTVFNPNPPITAPYSRPALSPYLNLLRGGNPAANYYMGVLTEYDRRFQQSRIGIPTEPAPYLTPSVDYRLDVDIPERKLSPTGHPAGFLIYQGYFNIPNQRSFLPANPNMNRQIR